MDSQKINKTLEMLTPLLDRIVAPDIREGIVLVLNIIEETVSECEAQHKIIQDLKDENNRLKGEQGKPKINPQKKEGNDKHSSDKDRNARKKKAPRKKRNKKKEIVKINRSVVCTIDTSKLPMDAQYKGYKSNIIQDLKVISDNIEFKREVYYSPSLKKTFIADIPNGYDGEFGPNIKTLVVSLYHNSNMTQPALKDFFDVCGVDISKATISRMLTDKHDSFHQEKEDIIDAGLKGPYQQTDDTSGRVNGKNQYVHILCNQFYMAFFTRPKKDRLTLLEILCRSELMFSLNEEAFEIMKSLGISQKVLRRVVGEKGKGIFTRSEIDHVLKKLFPKAKKQKTNRRIILEAAALAYYHSLPHAIKHLMCDDAPQFNLIAMHHSLCWIHEGRHYKKLRPIVPIHQKLLDDVSNKLWDFYQKLLDYTEKPTAIVSKQLSDEFDVIFSTQTGYDELDARLTLTRDKK
ncbi:MAG: transposase, partial [Deltaproteobacteria bacterium]|nr:transposase [Deltaproteobacteria bacterium]